MPLKINILLVTSLITAGGIYLAAAPTQAQIPARDTSDTVELKRRMLVCAETERWLRDACFSTLIEQTLTVGSRERALIQDRVQTAVRPKPPAAQVISDPEPAPVIQVDEMHMVGIYEPRVRRSPDGQVSSAPVRVIVDRPGKAVALVLASHENTTWDIQVTPATKIARVVLGGHRAGMSRATVNTVPYEAEHAKIPFAYQIEGERFHPFHDAARRHIGVEKASGFQGAYQAPETGFKITNAVEIKTRDEVMAALMEAAVDRSTLPKKLMDALENGPAANLVFNEKGISGTDRNGAAIAVRLTPNMPRVSWPSGAAQDADGKWLWGVSFGGEGFLYRYDASTKEWSAWSMNNKDVGDIIFNDETGYLIAVPGLTSSDFVILDTQGAVIREMSISPKDFPGLIDTYDPGNGPAPTFKALAVQDNKILVQTAPRHAGLRNQGTRSLIYVVDLALETVQLVK